MYFAVTPLRSREITRARSPSRGEREQKGARQLAVHAESASNHSQKVLGNREQRR